MRKTILFIFLFTGKLFSQVKEHHLTNVKLQYGLSVSLKWEIVFKYGYLSNYRLDIGGGVGALIEKNMMPFAQYSITAFQGGLGSSISVKERNKINLESMFALGLSGGSQRDNDLYFKRPLYTMGRLVATPLYNPFDIYATLATTFVYRHTKFSTPIYGTDKYRYSQRVGSLSFGDAGWDFNYYNDGTPFHWMGLGDGKDRYWTGGGFFNIHVSNYFDKTRRDAGNNTTFRNIFIGFDRFTGYYSESFEVANNLGLNSVPYGDKTQAFFNKGRVFAGVEIAGIPGLTPIFSLNDRDKSDIQYVIHNIRDQPIHKTLHKQSNALNLFYTRNYWDFK